MKSISLSPDPRDAGATLSYKGALTAAMTRMAQDQDVVFVGYGVKHGGKAAGTLQHVPDHQLIETPVAENLMVGLAIGLALKGKRPVVFIERFDFILNALDAIVNHLDKIHEMSKGDFHPCIILRVVVGNRNKPLFTGATHTQDFTSAMLEMVKFPVKQLETPGQITHEYHKAHTNLCLPPLTSTMLVEYKDLY